MFLLVGPVFPMDCTKYPFSMACRGVTSLVKRNHLPLVQRPLQPAPQNHLQPSLDQLETAAQERERIGEAQKDEIEPFWSLFPQPPGKRHLWIPFSLPPLGKRHLWSIYSHSPGKRQMKSGGLFSNILGSSWDKQEDKDMALSMLMTELEAEKEMEMLERIGKTSSSKILSNSPTSCNQGKLTLNQEHLDEEQDFKGNFPQQMMTRPRKRETELLLGEVGPGRGLFSNILSRLDSGRRKRAQSVKSLFTHILRKEDEKRGGFASLMPQPISQYPTTTDGQAWMSAY